MGAGVALTPGGGGAGAGALSDSIISCAIGAGATSGALRDSWSASTAVLGAGVEAGAGVARVGDGAGASLFKK